MALNRVTLSEYGILIDGVSIKALEGIKIDYDIDEAPAFSEVTIKFLGEVSNLNDEWNSNKNKSDEEN